MERRVASRRDVELVLSCGIKATKPPIEKHGFRQRTVGNIASLPPLSLTFSLSHPLSLRGRDIHYKSRARIFPFHVTWLVPILHAKICSICGCEDEKYYILSDCIIINTSSSFLKKKIQLLKTMKV